MKRLFCLCSRRGWLGRQWLKWRGLYHVVSMMVLGVLLLAGACQSPGQGSAPKLPPLSAVRSQLPPLPPDSTPDSTPELPRDTTSSIGASDPSRTSGPGPVSTRPRALAELTRLDLPLLGPGLDEAWRLVDESDLDAAELAAWRDNGLRVGLLDRKKWRSFVRDLPQAVNARVERFVTDDRPTLLLASRSLDEAFEVALPDCQDSPSVDPVTRGRLQLLIRLMPGKSGRRVMQLTPHHHVPKTSILPRSARDKLLEGRLYTELSLRVELPPGMLLVIRPDLPPPDELMVLEPVASTDRTDKTEPESEPTQGQPTQDPDPGPNTNTDTDNQPHQQLQPSDDDSYESTPPVDSSGDPAHRDRPPTEMQPSLRLPNHFGRWLLTASRTGRPVQMLVVVAVSAYP